MKKVLFLLTSQYIISSFTFAQGLKNLDNDFGINKFKLESFYKSHESYLEYFDTNKDGIEMYFYNGKDIKEVFDYPIRKLGLGFFEDKLYFISVNFGILEKRQNLALLDNMIFKYNTPELDLVNNSERVWVAQWETGKVYLQATEYSCNSDVFACQTEIFILSKKLKKLIEDSR